MREVGWDVSRRRRLAARVECAGGSAQRCGPVDAIAYLYARLRPLALYYFGADSEERRKVLSRTTSGNVTINGTIMHIAEDDLPFGGVAASGMGAYHGVEGFCALSHAKGIFEPGRWNSIDSPCTLREPG